jgi:uncharacterized protein YdhG (YjbR/CyaY superfamily)
MKRKTSTSVDDYIEDFPKETQELLQKMRSTIRKAAPKADEVISYGMPGYKQNRMLVWFAGFKHHIGFYPGVSGIENFEKELSPYKKAVGSVQFPIDRPLPLTLVRRIVKFRLKEDQGGPKSRR